MTNLADEKSAANVKFANMRLDSIGPLNVLRTQFGLTSDEIDERSRKLTGKRLARAVLWRFATNHPDAPKSLPGITEVGINVMAATETGIAERALLADYQMRCASHRYLYDPSEENKAKLLQQLEFAQIEVDKLRRLLKALKPADSIDTERLLDLAAVDYTEGQIRIHKGRLLPPEKKDEKHREFMAGMSWMTAVMTRLNHAVRSGEHNAERIDLIVAVNAGLNAYFVGYELDDLSEDKTLQRARTEAQKLAAPLFLRAAHAAASWQQDPRVAFNVASAAGLARQPIAAAKSLRLAAQLDGHDGKILEWNPKWLTETLSQSAELADAIEILDREGA